MKPSTLLTGTSTVFRFSTRYCTRPPSALPATRASNTAVTASGVCHSRAWMPPFTSTAGFGESLRGVRIRIADDIGPDLAPRERLADHLAVHLVVEREQRLVLREERGIFAKSRDRRHRCDRHGRRIAERDVRARVVVVGVGEEHVAAARGEGIRDLAVVVESAYGGGGQRGAEEQRGEDRAAHRSSHRRVFACSCGEPAPERAKRSSSARAAGLPSRLSASTSRRCSPSARASDSRRPISALTPGSPKRRERRRRGRRNAGVRQCLEQETPRRGVVRREPAGLEHRGGRDVGAAACAHERLECGVWIERAPCRGQRRQGLPLVGVVDEQGEEFPVGEPLGDDQRERIDTPALRQRAGDGGPLRGDLRGRCGAKRIGDAGTHGVRRRSGKARDGARCCAWQGRAARSRARRGAPSSAARIARSRRHHIKVSRARRGPDRRACRRSARATRGA